MAKKLVGIYCGHGRSTDGSWDPGTTYSGENEAALMLPITKAAVKYLKASGVAVDTDANDGNNINMIKQVERANKKKVDVFVSLHCDYHKAPSGTMPLYVSASGKKLATAINKAVVADMDIKSRGATKRTDLYELNDTNMPACVFETGSIKADIATLKKADAYGKAIAKGICDYLGVKFKAPTEAADFAVKTKGKLIVRKAASLQSEQVCTTERGAKLVIVKVDGNRGKLGCGKGWITITDKYVDRV